MGGRIVCAAIGIDRDIGVRLADGDRRRAALVEVVGSALKVPGTDATRGVSEADSKC